MVSHEKIAYALHQCPYKCRPCIYIYIFSDVYTVHTNLCNKEVRNDKQYTDFALPYLYVLTYFTQTHHITQAAITVQVYSFHCAPENCMFPN